MENQMYRILELIGVAGEMPTGALARVPGGKEYRRKCIGRAKKEGLIKLVHKDGLEGYRLTAAGKKLLLESNEERFSFFLSGSTDSNRVQAARRRRVRIHRTAEAYVIMQNAGVEIFRDRKLLVFSKAQTPEGLIFPAYYGSREMKEAGQEFVKVKNSRAVGTLITPGGYFLVYNTGAGEIKWFEGAEERLIYEAPDYLKRAGVFPRSMKLSPKGIMLAESMDSFAGFLIGGKQKFAFPKSGGKFQSMYWIPNTTQGEAMVKLLCREDVFSGLHQALEENFFPPPASSALDIDALDDNGEPVLFACTFDAVRLNRFILSLEYDRCHGSVVCFDFQKKLMEEFCGRCISVKAVELNGVRQMYGF